MKIFNGFTIIRREIIRRGRIKEVRTRGKNMQKYDKGEVGDQRKGRRGEAKVEY